MKYSLCTPILLAASAAAISIPLSPHTIFDHPPNNSSLLTALLTNATKTHLGAWGDWPALPFRPQIGQLAFDINAYGRKANVPRFSTVILDSLDNIIHKLDTAGRPSDLLGQLDIVSYNGLVRVRFGSSDHEGRMLTRLDASEVLANIWDLTVKYGPREILLAEIEDRESQELMALFELLFPGPIFKVKAVAEG